MTRDVMTYDPSEHDPITHVVASGRRTTVEP